MRLAIVLYNLGGPDCPEAVAPFLFNLFNDRAILGLPQPLRGALARLIAARRAPKAREIYGQIGGRSPIVEETEAQASALRQALQEAFPPAVEWAVFIAMRYWRPAIASVVKDVKRFSPTRLVLLPLYPQFSTTTTGSFVQAWKAEARRQRLDIAVTTLCCYPLNRGFVEAHAELLRRALRKAGTAQSLRVLFSAHGLPKRVVRKGDPYEWQVKQSAAGIVKALGEEGLDWRICYQSRVGPLEWLEPSTEDEIRRAGSEGKGIVLVPVAFVSEHAETLVELDIDYAKLAAKAGAAPYIRVPALRTEAIFVEALRALVLKASNSSDAVFAENGRICPKAFRLCPHGAP